MAMSDGQNVDDAYNHAVSKSEQQSKRGEVLREGRKVHNEGHCYARHEAGHTR